MKSTVRKGKAQLRTRFKTMPPITVDQNRDAYGREGERKISVSLLWSTLGNAISHLPEEFDQLTADGGDAENIMSSLEEVLELAKTIFVLSNLQGD